MTVYGIATGALNAGRDLPRKLDQAAALGCPSIRAAEQWERVEPVLGGGYDFRAVNEIIAECGKRGMTLVTGLVGRDNKTFDQAIPYAKAAAALAREVEGRVVALQLINEPDHVIADYNPTPERYMNLHLRAYEAIKAVAPDVLVSNGGLGGMQADWAPDKTAADFWFECYRLGMKGHVDIASFHPYSQPGTFRESIVAQRKGAYLLKQSHQISVDNGDKALPWLLSEHGWQTGGVRNPISETEQAARLKDAHAWCAKRAWVKAAYWFNLQDQADADIYNTGSWMGLLRKDGTRKPSADAFEALQAA